MVFLQLGLACGGEEPKDGDTGDTGPGEDSAPPGETGDTGQPVDTAETGETGETGTPGETGETGDTGEPVEVPLDGFGQIGGDCGVLDEELSSGSPSFHRNSIDFGKLEYDYHLLSEGGQEVYDDGNLGGSSIYSEIVAYELLYRCELAALIKTEGEIAYQDEGGKKTDLLVEIGGLNLGVSVTRAYGYPPEDPYTVEQASELLDDKLGDVLSSSANVAKKDAWVKQILHVVAYAEEHADAVEQAYGKLDAATQADTILVVTTTEGNDEFVY